MNMSERDVGKTNLFHFVQSQKSAKGMPAHKRGNFSLSHLRIESGFK